MSNYNEKRPMKSFIMILHGIWILNERGEPVLFSSACKIIIIMIIMTECSAELRIASCN